MKLIYVAVFPVILLLFYIYKKDIDKEPRGILTRLFIFGGISVIPLAILELIMSSLIPGDFYPTFISTCIATFVKIGMVEEFGKWFITYLCTYRRREYNHAYDGIVYAVFASLGFACIENIIYVLSSGFSTGIMRAFLSVPSHAVDAVFMGVLLSKSKQYLVNKDNGKAFKYLLLSIFVPAITHSVYDGLIFYYQSSENEVALLLFFGLVIVSYIVSFILIKKEAKKEFNFDGTPCRTVVPTTTVIPTEQPKTV